MRFAIIAALLFLTADDAFAAPWQTDSVGSSSSQDAEAKVSEPPKLTPVFSDDFGTDTRAQYRSTGNVTWDPGKLTLSSDASLERVIHGGSWAKVTLSPQLPSLSADRPESELRIWFMLDGATGCHVRLRQTLADGKSATSIAFVDTVEQENEPTERVVRELVLGEVASGAITIEYRHGLVCVRLPGAEAFFGYVNKGGVKGGGTVRAIRVTCSHQPVGLAAFGVTREEPDQAKYTDAESQQLAEAAEIYGELVTLYQQAKFREAATLYEQVLRRQKAVLGVQHSEYANSLNNLAILHMRMGSYERAEPLYKQAVTIKQVVLGEQHPIYARSLSNLGLLYAYMGDDARAEPLYRQVLDIEKTALGEQHLAYAVTLNNLGTLYRRVGDYDRAEAC